MGLRGLLNGDDLGFSMPADAPLYPNPPYTYRDASMIVFEYVTDGPSAARILPDKAELTDPPVAGLIFADYPECSLGPYREVVVYLHAIYEGKPIKYAAYLYVTSDVAMAVGREMGGYPKKIGAITYEDAGTISATFHRPDWQPIASAWLKPIGEPIEQPDALLSYLTLRIIPSPTKRVRPDVCELLESGWRTSNVRVWQGEGEFAFEGASMQDPLHLLPMVKLLGCKLIRCDLDVEANDSPSSTPF